VAPLYEAGNQVEVRVKKQILIAVEDIELLAELEKSITAEKIFDALPIEATVNTWGEEIYFDIGISAALEADARADMQVGELGYWPPGNAFCIFFGRTPASTSEQPKAASPVNVIGKLVGDASQCKRIPDAARVRLTRA
jgi:hypothetical protein